MASKEPIFVVGTSRSGTTLLRMMLCAHPRIHLTHEASFYIWESAYPWWHRQPWQFVDHYVETFSFRWLRVDPTPIVDALPRPIERQHIPEFYRQIMRAKANEYGKLRYGDKTPGHVRHLDRIFRDFPGARVVRIVRDPRGVVESLTRMPWGPRSLIAASAHCEGERQHAARFRDRILEIRLEDLLESPRPTMERVLAYIDEPWSEYVLNHSEHLPDPSDLPPVPWFQAAASKRSKPVPNRSSLSQADQQLVESLNRKGLVEMAYVNRSPPPVWKNSIAFWRLLADLPEFCRFLVAFIRLGWASRLPRNTGSPRINKLFARVNPQAWRHYPGFELPDVPPLPPDWQSLAKQQQKALPPT